MTNPRHAVLQNGTQSKERRRRRRQRFPFLPGIESSRAIAFIHFLLTTERACVMRQNIRTENSHFHRGAFVPPRFRVESRIYKSISRSHYNNRTAHYIVVVSAWNSADYKGKVSGGAPISGQKIVGELESLPRLGRKCVMRRWHSCLRRSCRVSTPAAAAQCTTSPFIIRETGPRVAISPVDEKTQEGDNFIPNGLPQKGQTFSRRSRNSSLSSSCIHARRRKIGNAAAAAAAKEN